MKNASFFSTTLPLLAVLFIQPTAQAQQWLQNAITKTITTNAAFNAAAAANVGIGTATPTNARLDVQGGIGNTVASFRLVPASKGISIVSDWPGVYFNAYFNSGAKAMAPGYAGIVNFDPDYGRFDFGITGTASTAANSAVNLTARMSIDKNGNVGIGIPPSASSSKLDIAAQDGLRIIGYQPFLTLLDNNSWQSARIQAANGDIIFYRGVNSNYIPQMLIKASGNMLIGTSNDHGYKLAVNGNIRAKEIRVQSNWADYVFADDYQLRPLAEVEAFINENKHLPDIQPACEIQEDGLDMAATTTKMMAKIEELTLYLIDQNKRLEQLEQANAMLRSRLAPADAGQK